MDWCIGRKTIFMKKIILEQVSFGYEKNKMILNDISIDIKEGDTIGIIGANGVGKSTLLKLLVGLLQGYSGIIEINGMAVEKKHLMEIRKQIGYVFQDAESQLFMNTVAEDIAFAPRNYGMEESEVQKRVSEALRLTGIEHLKDRQIYRLSGGEKKLVSIATILSMMPEIILLDEPTIALDPRNRRNLIHLLNSFSQIKVIASHDLDFIMDTCEKTVLMKDGKIIKIGRTRDIMTDQDLLEENGLELPLRFYKE